MHFVIMGCGRVGASLTRRLERSGHDVAVIDTDERAFDRLDGSFEGTRVVGVGFDQDTLREAGIERAYALAAVSNGDNSNIIAARVARERFGVAHVVARIYDPERAAVYERLGIPTVATVRWTTDQMMRRILPQKHLPEFVDPAGRITLAELPIHESWVGVRHSVIEELTAARVAFISRLGTGILTTGRTVHQEGDLVHFTFESDHLAQIESVLQSAPPS